MIYTKKGDSGTTSLVGGTIVSKSSPRLEAYGTVDELNSHIGLLLSLDGIADNDRRALQRIQNLLFNLGGQLATEEDSPYQSPTITPDAVKFLENEIDTIDGALPRHNRFILPGGTVAAAQANVARTVARRAERRMVEMVSSGISVDTEAMNFINRLSDYLFVLSRQINLAAGTEEIFWDKNY